MAIAGMTAHKVLSRKGLQHDQQFPGYSLVAHGSWEIKYASFLRFSADWKCTRSMTGGPGAFFAPKAATGNAGW